MEERAAALAGYARSTFAEIDRVLAEVPTGARPRVYLARGPDGLETGLKGSIDSEIIERAGGINVAEVGDDRQGIAQVQLERVLLWNPDTIVTWDGRFVETVRDDPAWVGIAAVRAGRVFLGPSLPFGWIDRPPSVNRPIGLRWLAGLFFPERLPVDPRAEARKFHRLFYQVEPDEAALDRLLGPLSGHAP